MQIPALCPNCGLVFGSGIEVGINSLVQLSGNASMCWRCRAIAPIPDGVMEIVQQGIRLLKGPDLTKEIFELFQVTVEDWRSGKVTPEEGEARLAKRHRGLASFFGKLVENPLNLVTCICTVMMAYWMWQDRPSNQSANEVISEATEAYYASPQADRRNIGGSSVDQMVNQAPRAVRTPAQSHIEAPHENRKARRAAAAQDRKKRR